MIPGADVFNTTSFVLGIVGGYVAVRYRLTVSDRASQISDHIKDFEKLHEASVAYWSSPFDAEKGNERRIRVLSYHAIAMRIYPDISLMALSVSTRYENLVSEYFRACTGGDFDDPDRSADLAKALELSRIHAQLVEDLRHVRRDLSSLSMLLRDVFEFCHLVWRKFHSTFLVP